MLMSMKQIRQQILLITIVILALGHNAYAVWIGEGEVTGTVLTARRVGDHVDFEMTVATQKNELHGSTLASPNHFTYSGPRRLEISRGDKLRLRVRYSNANGIIVERIEMLENQPGAPEEVPSKSLVERAKPFAEGIILGVFAVRESPLAISLLVLLLLASAVVVGWRRGHVGASHKG